jgi:hypothetical protein
MSSFLDTVIRNNMEMQSLMVSQMVARSALQQSLSRRGLRLSKQQRAAADRFAKYRGTMFRNGAPVMPKRLAARLISQPGKQRTQLEQVFRELLRAYAARSRQQNAPANDLARTLAFCIAANYAYATEQEVSAAGLAELRRKIRAAFTSDAKFRAISDLKKQELSESLVILTLFAALGYDEAKAAKKPELQSKFKMLARANLQSMLGVPVQRVRLEKTGLIIAR